jgi:hypothetical protein
MSRIKRMRPSTEEDRKLASDLRRIIASSRSSKAEKEAAARELDTVAPPRPKGAFGSPAKNEDSKPLTRDLLALCDRVEARRAGDESILLPSPPALLSATDIQTVREMDLKEASAEWYRLVQSQWPEKGFERIAQRTWLLRWRMDTLKGTVTESFADYVKPIQLRFEADMEFSARFAVASPEQRDTMLDERLAWMRTKESETPAPSMPRIVPPSGPPAKVPAPVQEKPTFALRSTPEVPVRPEPSPIQAAGIDLAARAALVLQTDSWLTRLAEHSPDMRVRLVQSLSDELLRAGCVSGDFCARTYNALRPRAVSQYPERRF